MHTFVYQRGMYPQSVLGCSPIFSFFTIATNRTTKTTATQHSAEKTSSLHVIELGRRGLLNQHQQYFCGRFARDSFRSKTVPTDCFAPAILPFNERDVSPTPSHLRHGEVGHKGSYPAEKLGDVDVRRHHCIRG